MFHIKFILVGRPAGKTGVLLELSCAYLYTIVYSAIGGC